MKIFTKKYLSSVKLTRLSLIYNYCISDSIVLMLHRLQYKDWSITQFLECSYDVITSPIWHDRYLHTWQESTQLTTLYCTPLWVQSVHVLQFARQMCWVIALERNIQRYSRKAWRQYNSSSMHLQCLWKLCQTVLTLYLFATGYCWVL